MEGSGLGGEKMDGEGTGRPGVRLDAVALDAAASGSEQIFGMHTAGISVGGTPKQLADGDLVIGRVGFHANIKGDFLKSFDSIA